MKKISERNIKINLKRYILAYILFLFAGILRLLRKFSHSDYKSRTILIIEPFGMGDIISLEPMVRILAEQKYDVKICARTSWRPILSKEYFSFWLDSKVPWSDYDIVKKYSLRNIFNKDLMCFIKDLRLIGKGSIGLDVRGDIRSIILLYIAGCSKVLTFSHYIGTNLRNPDIVADVVNVRDDCQRWKLNLELLNALGINVPENTSPPRVKHLEANSSKLSYVVFIPVSPWLGKLWQKEKWRKLYIDISKSGMHPLILCGPGQVSMASEISNDLIDVFECSSIEAWVEQLQRALVVITTNTGPMHLADALNKPLVVIEGPCKLPLWAPSGKNSCVVHYQDKITCAPCHQVGNTLKCKHECMDKITVEDVMNAVKNVLKNNTSDFNSKETGK